MKASELNLEWLIHDPHAMTEPIVIDDQDGLFQMGMRMPSKDLTIGRIAELVGIDTPVEVIDVASQAELSRWTLGQWAHYFQNPKRDRIRNVISLEVSETSLGQCIQLPKIVTDMDWVHTTWPSHLRTHGSGSYPKVQKYCLMSVARCWTDWHIDFAGSSVFYHILRGAKTFYFIRPTVANLVKYEKWAGGSKSHESTWLGDQVNVVYKVSLTAGQTMMIPTGWIHAVHTPMDSLVFGGNFLHSLNITTQLRVYQIENSTKVPKKFRFPFFIHTLWFVLLHYNKKLELANEQLDSINSITPSDPSINLDSCWPIPHQIRTGLLALSEFLLAQADPLDSHPPSSSKDLLNYLECHLESDKIANQRQTIVNFQKLLSNFPSPSPSNASILKPGSGEHLHQSTHSSNIVGVGDSHHRADGMDKPAATFKSPLQITIKRKIRPPCVEQNTEKMMVKDCGPENKPSNKITRIKIIQAKGVTNHDGNDKINSNSKMHDFRKRRGDENVKVEGMKSNKPKPNSKLKSKTNIDIKKTLTTPNSINQLMGGEILMISNPTPTNAVRFEKRKRPQFENDKRQEPPTLLQKIKNDDDADDDESGRRRKKYVDDTLHLKLNEEDNRDGENQVQPSPNDVEDRTPVNNEQQENEIQPQKLIELEDHEGQNDLADDDQDKTIELHEDVKLRKEKDEEEVEVQTTSALNSVVRKWFDASKNKIIYETRTVKTTIEKVYFDP